MYFTSATQYWSLYCHHFHLSLPVPFFEWLGCDITWLKKLTNNIHCNTFLPTANKKSVYKK